MAEFIRVSHHALDAIPEEHRHTMHRMYEDNDVEGADNAKETFDFIEKEAPGSFVIILANDCVSPPCCNEMGHFHCDYYAPYWYTVLVAGTIWNQYEDAVMAKDQEWKDAHQCKVQAKEQQS